MLRKLHQRVGVEKKWEVEVAALVARIRCVTLPKKERFKADLTKEEEKIIACIPEASANFIEKIPRLRSVARIILYLNKNYDGSGFPDDSIKEKKLSFRFPTFTNFIRFDANGIRRYSPR